MANQKFWLWLTGRRGLAGQQLIQVLNHFGSPEQVYYADPAEYELLEGIPGWVREGLREKSLEEADRIAGECDRLGIRIMTMQDSCYPERLKAIHQPPLVLYWKGRELPLDDLPAIAMVGTRGCTPYGERVAHKLAGDLTRAGALVVSGMAQGIDAAALRGALQAGGPVISVLGCGIDVIYPSGHGRLYADVAAVGALVSEYPPGTAPKGSSFPVRNRIISGLSVGVTVVESPARGGALITANHALEQNREVFAVPGPVDVETSEGTNRIIQEGAAKLIMDAEDILCELEGRFRLGGEAPAKGERPGRFAAKHRGKPSVSPKTAEKKEVDNSSAVEYIVWREYRDKLTDDQRDVLLALENGDLTADDIMERTRIPARRALSALTILQVQGYIREEGGGRFHGNVRILME